MRRQILILFLSAVLVFATDWKTNLEDAHKEATEKNKAILIYFSGSDWCRPCILLKKKVFETDVFAKYADKNLITVQFDFPAREKNKPDPEQIKYNEKMADIFNPDGDFPLVVILDNNKKELNRFIGYSNSKAQDFISKIEDTLKQK